MDHALKTELLGMNFLASLSSVRIAKHHFAKFERLRHERRACIGAYVCFTLSLRFESSLGSSEKDVSLLKACLMFLHYY